MLFLLGFFRLFELLEAELAVVHHLDDRRLLTGSDLHEVEPALFRYSLRLVGCNDTRLPFSDETDRWGCNILIDSVFTRVFRLEPAIFYTVDNRPPCELS